MSINQNKENMRLPGEVNIQGESIAIMLASIHDFLKRMNLNNAQREKVIVALLKFACYEHNKHHLWADTIQSILIEEHIKQHEQQ